MRNSVLFSRDARTRQGTPRRTQRPHSSIESQVCQSQRSNIDAPERQQRCVKRIDHSRANDRGMRHCNRVTGIALSIEPSSNAAYQIHNRLPAMRSGSSIGQPRSHMLRLPHLHLGEFNPVPSSVIAVAQLSRYGSGKTQSLGSLLRATLRTRQNLLRSRCIPAEPGDLRQFSLLQRFVQWKCGSALCRGGLMADET